MSEGFDWKPGKGQYIGTDVSTYVVRGSDGTVITAFVNGSPYGRGDSERMVVRRNGKLVVQARYVLRDDEEAPEVVLEDGMEGWWEISGRAVFVLEARARERSRRPAREATHAEDVGVADVLPVIAVVAEAPPPANAGGTRRDVVIPDWVDELVDKIASKYVIVAGSNRAVLVGRLGTANDRYEWWRADHMEDSLFGDRSLRIEGSYKNAILTRLRKRAVRTIGTTQFHPHSAAGGILRQTAGRWVHTAADGNVRDICAKHDAALYNVHWIDKLGANKRMGLGWSSGDWRAVVGVLVDGDPAYPGLTEPLEIVIPCPPGGQRNVIYVVEQLAPDGSSQFDVYGFTITRDIDGRTRPALTRYEGSLDPSFYPYSYTQKGEKKLCILYMPD